MLQNRYDHLQQTEDVSELKNRTSNCLHFTSDFLLSVVEVATCEECAEDEGGHKHLLQLVLNNRNTHAVIPYFDLILLATTTK